MASGNQLVYLSPEQLQPEQGPAQMQRKLLAGARAYPGGTTGVALAGVPLNKLDQQGYQFVTRLPSTAALATGLTFLLDTVDDPNNPGAGLVAVIGITVKRLVSGTDTYTTASAATEVTANLTCASTVGVYTTLSKAIANAALPASLAAGDKILVRIRRLGSNSSDTHQGTVLLMGVAITDT